jgi:hypothetical protein
LNGCMHMPDLARQAQADVTEFMTAYIELLTALGGDDTVQQMKKEVDFRVKQGAELAEALAEHYEHTRRKYGLPER